MGARRIVRSVIAVFAAVVMLASLSLAALAVAPSGADARRGAGFDPQAIPGSDHRLTGIDTDRGRVKPAGSGTFATPSGRHGPDVPGQRVEPMQQPMGRIVTPAAPSRTDIQAIRDAIAANGTARVNVTTRLPRGLSADAASPAAARQRAQIRDSLDLLRDGVRSTGSRELSRIRVYPFATYQLTQRGLEAMLADSNVTWLGLDGSADLSLDVSTGIIDSDLLNTAGTQGNGWSGSPVGAAQVVIIDSGVDNDHAAFAGRVVAEACFSAGADCPGGLTSSTAADSADSCTYAVQCDHGTHVASIAAGTSYTGGHEGVARGARIVAIQVGTDAMPGWSANFSDINSALQFAINRKNGGQNVVAVNMSLGINGFARVAACDAENGTFSATQALAANLQNLGVAVVASAGNDNLTGVSYPACLSSVFAVSATDDSDVPASFTDSGGLTDWFAPGVNIDAAIPGVNTHANKNGTSMAAPHVTGAFALLRGCVDGNGVTITNASAVSRLNATGVNVTDNGATRKRINVLDAATGLVNNNDFASPEIVPANPGTGLQRLRLQHLLGHRAGRAGTLQHRQRDLVRLDAVGDRHRDHLHRGQRDQRHDVRYDRRRLHGLDARLPPGHRFGRRFRDRYSQPHQGLGRSGRHLPHQDRRLRRFHRSAQSPCPERPDHVRGRCSDDPRDASRDHAQRHGGADVIAAGPGNDTVNSGDGNDRVCGDEGDDDDQRRDRR